MAQPLHWVVVSVQTPRADVTQADGVASASLCCMALGTVRGRQATQF